MTIDNVGEDSLLILIIRRQTTYKHIGKAMQSKLIKNINFHINQIPIPLIEVSNLGVDNGWSLVCL